MGLILCIETGTPVCSVALVRDGKVIALEESGEGRDHARLLGVFIDKILRSNGLRASQLSAVAVSSGPGSYTGLRIGVSMAKGLCYSLGIPLIAVGSLEAMAHTAAEDLRTGRVAIDDFENSRLCPMIDARRMEVYTQVFDPSLQPLTQVAAQIVTPESLTEWRGGAGLVVFGDGAAKCEGVLTHGVRFIDVAPSARGQAVLAQKAFDEENFVELAYFEPFYLKDFVVKESTKKMF